MLPSKIKIISNTKWNRMKTNNLIFLFIPFFLQSCFTHKAAFKGTEWEYHSSTEKAGFNEYQLNNLNLLGTVRRKSTGHAWWIAIFRYLWIFFSFSLLDAVMKEPVILEQDDVEVLNKPAANELYEPKHYDTSNDL